MLHLGTYGKRRHESEARDEDKRSVPLCGGADAREFVGLVCWKASPDKDDSMADCFSESYSIVFGVMGVIMESVRSSRNDCKKKGHALKDCSKFSAWLAGCNWCKTDGASDTGKLECASNWLGGQGSTTTGGEEALHKVTAFDSGMPPRLYQRSQERGNEWQSSKTWRTNILAC